MIALLVPALLALSGAEGPAQDELPELKTRFWELRDGGKKRAVVLVHGLQAQLLDAEKPHRPEPPDWLSPESAVVRALAEHGSVFGFSYSQNRKVQDVPAALLPCVEKLRADGYGEIALVGFSAGGLIVRQFVEDHPAAGVAKVVQVCAPNGGSELGKLDRAVRAGQEPFVRSLRKEERAAFSEERAKRGVRIPDGVEFVAVVGSLAGQGDGVLSRSSQWSPDLQEQGIPVAKLDTVHGLAMRSESCARTLCRLLVTPQPRWPKEGVEAARKEILD